MRNNYGNYYMLVVTDVTSGGELQYDYTFDNAEAARKRATSLAASNPNLGLNLYKMLQNHDPIEVMI